MFKYLFPFFVLFLVSAQCKAYSNDSRLAQNGSLGAKSEKKEFENEHESQALSKLEKNIPTKSANIVIGKFDLPVGSIILWIPSNSNHSQKEGNIDLPKDFLLCDGPHENDDPKTIFDERMIPRLDAQHIVNDINNVPAMLIIKVN